MAGMMLMECEESNWFRVDLCGEAPALAAGFGT
jgi:hypothetical protein